MKRHWLLVAAVAGMPFAAPAEEAQKAAAPAANPQRAQQIVSQVCAACHGADGNSPSPANPNLAGQAADYITLQLAHFKAGIRPSPIMQPMAATLSDDDMRALGAYFAQQKPKGLTAKDASTVKMAQQLYRGGDAENDVPACASCHSPDGAGIPKNFPRVGGQHADYTYAQLQAFKMGQRGNDKEGKDVNGRIMGTIASRLSDAQMKAVADYTAGLR
ncbi:MAG TPA: c-type cytochrome [Casimicrobiaceae bacterium]|jgi:cytochrome c553